MDREIRIGEDVYLKAPFGISEVTELRILMQTDCHACMLLVGTASEMEEENILSMDENSVICLFTESEGQKSPVFCGIPVHISFDHKGKREFRIEAAGSSITMDWKKKSRSFQRKNIHWEDVAGEIVKEYQGDFLFRSQGRKSCDYPLIQSHETDWEFIKRIGRVLGKPVYTTADQRDIRLYMGVSGEDKADLSLENKTEHMVFHKKNGGSAEAAAMREFTVKSREHYHLGQSVSCDGDEYVITRAGGELYRGQMEFTYRLKQTEDAAGKETPARTRCGHRGLSGKVIAVEKNRVKLHLDLDSDQTEENAHWYPWHRSDWFCMPETGSEASLFLPESEEEKAYVTAVRHGEGNEKTQQPETERMETAEGKGWKTDSSSLTLTASDGDVYLELSGGGIVVKSSEGMKFTGREIQMESGRIFLKSREQIVLCTSGNYIVMDELIQLKG